MRPLAVTTWVLLCAPLLLSAGQRITKKEEDIPAVPGQNVTLPCGAGKETQIEAVHWIRPDLHPDVVLLYRDGRVESDQHPSFRNRVDLQDRQMKDGDASLILKNVTTKDTGTYTCRVNQGGGKRRKRAAKEISTIHLVVSPPPETQEGGGEEGGQAGRGHLGLGLGLVASVLGIVVVIAAVLFRKMKKTPPPPPEGAPVQPLV